MDSSLASALAGLVGERHVRAAHAERLAYAMDGLPTHHSLPGLAVLPGTRDEVVAVVRLLADLEVPFVPRGAGTGLSGGAHGLKYGVTTSHILALEVVRAGGSVVNLGSPGGEPWGPDLVGVFVGSEGNFGVATRITVRLVPLPRAVRTLLADFSSLRAAGEAVSAIIGAGLVPAALEMMDRSCIQAVEDSVYAAGYPRDAAAVLLVELDGRSEAAVDEEAHQAAGLLTAHGARHVRQA